MTLLSKRLQIKSGSNGLLINPPDFFLRALDPLPDGVNLTVGKEGKFDYVHLFVRSLSDLKKYASVAFRSLKGDGLFWVSYPKRSGSCKTDISRDCGWPELVQAGFKGVRQVSLNDTWSALRFRE